MKLPSAEIAAVALLRELLPGVAVATTIPDPLPDGGFVHASIVATRTADTMMRNPTVQYDAYMESATAGGRPPWAACSQLAETVARALETPGVYISDLTDVEPFTVHSWHAGNEPRRIASDPKGYARYTLDAEVHWTPNREVPLA